MVSDEWVEISLCETLRFLAFLAIPLRYGIFLSHGKESMIMHHKECIIVICIKQLPDALPIIFNQNKLFGILNKRLACHKSST